MSDQQAPVSVIIPCYRCVDTIERAVESVAAQTLLPSEIILVDDFSTDNTLAKLYELKHRYPTGWIKIIAQPSNRGPASARNAGWSVASHKYLAFLDSDDTWHPQKVEFQFEWMERNPDFTLCGHAIAQMDPKVSPFLSKFDKKSQVIFSPISKCKLLLRNSLSTPTVMVRKDASSRFTEEKRYSEDYLLWLMLACAGEKLAFCKLPLAFIHKASFGASGLSAHLWNMEKGELDTYHQVWKSKGTGIIPYIFLQIFSLARYIRRIIVSANRR